MFKPTPLVLGLLGLCSSVSMATTLSGTLRDFCNPAIPGTCAVVMHKDSPADPVADTPDFEGPIPGVVTGMVSTTLNASGLPDFVAPAGTGAADAASFATWYADVPGVNTSTPYSLSLTETAPGSGIYMFSDGAFFPLDGALFGDQGRSHNFHFTLHLEGLLKMDGLADGDETFSFTGDDDLWIYVDGKLFIDLGSVHGAASAFFKESDLIAAGLLPDVDYALDIFFAERHTSASSFSITTSLAISSPPGPTGVPEPASAALLALGACGLGFIRKHRAAKAPSRTPSTF